VKKTKLVNLSGQPKKAINPELAKINIKELDDVGAGLVFLRIVAQMYPGITWGQLMAMKNNKNTMGRSLWDKFKNFTGDLYDGGAQLIGDVVGGTGDILGSAVRLVTDEEVANGLSRAGAAYATGGSSEGLMAILGSFGNSAKAQASKNPMLFYGAIGLGGLIIFMLVKKD